MTEPGKIEAADSASGPPPDADVHSIAPPAATPDSSIARSRWGVTVALVITFLLIYLLRWVLLPFAAAAGLAYVGMPILNFLHKRWRLPRAVAAVLVFIGYLVVLAALGVLVRLFLVPELSRAGSRLPKTIRTFLMGAFHGKSIHLFGHVITAQGATANIMAVLGTLATPALAIKAASVGFAALMGGVLALVLLFYFLLDTPRLGQGALWAVPPPLRPRVRRIAARVNPVLGRYIRGVLIVMLYAGTLTFIVAEFILHFPHALLLSFGVGLLELIPVIGPILSIILIGTVAIQQATVAAIIGFAVFAIALRISIDQLVGPLVLGRAVTLSPVVILFAFLCGGALYGILGVLVAIPVAATIKIVLQEIYERGEPSKAEHI